MRKSTIAIVSLLMLAIPFQGFAAAIQSGCALGHHRSDPSSTASHSHDKHHDHAAMHAATQPDASTDSGIGTTQECKCGTCGLGTALPASKTDTALAPPHAAPLGRFIDLRTVMITGGPERPPRNLLA
jgi:hypothetical protein